MYKNLTTICAVAVLALGLAACGGGGGSDQANVTPTPPPPPPTPPMEYDVTLPAGHGLADGMTTIDAGATEMLPSGTYITCPGPDDCTVTVSTDEVTGVQSASSTGGMVAITTEATRDAADKAAAAEELRLAEVAVDDAEAALTAAREAYTAGTGTGNAVTGAEQALAMAVAHRDSLLPPPPEPEPTVYQVALPSSHGLAVGTTTLTAGTHRLDNGLRLKCEPEEGSESCELTVAQDTVTDLITASALGGAVTAAFPTTPHSYQAYTNLADALLDTDDLTKLRANLYHDVPDVAADSTATPPVVAVDNAGGITSSLTTHEEPAGGGAGTGTGVSDIAVTVSPEVNDPDDTDNSKVVQVIDTDATNDEDPTDAITDVTQYDQVRDPMTVNNPVLVDASGNITTGRMANFDAAADWDNNPAAEWMTDFMEGNPATDGMWTYELSKTESLAGGRTLHLDLRSDFNPDHTVDGTALNIARGPADDGALPKVPVDADMVRFDDLTIGVGTEVDFPTDRATGVMGSYMGVRGTFHCADGGTDEQGICRINQHTRGELTPSENSDLLVFTPLVYSADPDWLSLGVWLTTPNDPQGDYAIGAFAYGNDPYKPATVAAAQSLTGTATYEGEAFGRYAEATGIEGEDKAVGGFEATAMLTAAFGANNEWGSIQGNLSGFTADGESRDWDVNFEQATLKLGPGDNDGDPATADTFDTPNTALRFDAGASGHGTGGHALTGYWNGQFYGPSTMDDPANPGTPIVAEPGSVAGTFGLTTERDPSDDYSLTLIGAFGAHKSTDD